MASDQCCVGQTLGAFYANETETLSTALLSNPTFDKVSFCRFLEKSTANPYFGRILEQVLTKKVLSSLLLGETSYT